MGRTLRATWRASTGLEPIVRLWILRLVVELGADTGLVGAGGVSDAHLAEQLGLYADVSGKHLDPLAVKRRLRSLLSECEHDQGSHQLPPVLDENIARLAALVGLSDIDRHILGFAVLLTMNGRLQGSRGHDLDGRDARGCGDSSSFDR